MEIVYGIVSNLLLGAMLALLLAWRLKADAVRLGSADEALALTGQLLGPGIAGALAEGARATLASDGRAALVELKGGRKLGLLERRGRRWNAKLLEPGALRDLREDAGALQLGFADFGWPASRVAIADAAERSRWMARLRPLVEGGTDAR